jgi:hypothetical protein
MWPLAEDEVEGVVGFAVGLVAAAPWLIEVLIQSAQTLTRSPVTCDEIATDLTVPLLEPHETLKGLALADDGAVDSERAASSNNATRRDEFLGLGCIAEA